MRRRSVRKVLSPVLVGLSLVATLALSGAVVVAQDEPQQGGSLDLVALTDLATLDNSQAVSTIDYNMVAGALYEGLYHFTPDGELEPGLADGMPEVSEDGLVYTIKIKDGAMFAGPDFEPRPVTAADVAYGLTRALDPAPVGAPAQSWGAGYLFPIEGAAAFAEGSADNVTRHRGDRRSDPPDHARGAVGHLPLRPDHRDQLAGATGSRRSSWRGVRQQPRGCRAVLRPGVEQGLRYHHRSQPRLRRPGAALSR